MHILKRTAGCIALLADGSIGEYAEVLGCFAEVDDYAFGARKVGRGEDGYVWIAGAGVERKAGDCKGGCEETLM